MLVRDKLENATGVHAAGLATPVTVRAFDEAISGAGLPTYDPASTFLLYPSADACTAAELATLLAARRSEPPRATGADAPDANSPPPLTIVVPDTKWNNDGACLNHPSLRPLRRLRLRCPPAASRIWRSNARAVAAVSYTHLTLPTILLV